MKKDKYCYDSLEDYLVTHPNKDVSEHAVRIVSRYGNSTFALLETKLSNIPESEEYFKWIDKNK